MKDGDPVDVMDQLDVNASAGKLGPNGMGGGIVTVNGVAAEDWQSMMRK